MGELVHGRTEVAMWPTPVHAVDTDYPLLATHTEPVYGSESAAFHTEVVSGDQNRCQASLLTPGQTQARV
jgi:hypothetical protein